MECRYGRTTAKTEIAMQGQTLNQIQIACKMHYLTCQMVPTIILQMILDMVQMKNGTPIIAKILSAFIPALDCAGRNFGGLDLSLDWTPGRSLSAALSILALQKSNAGIEVFRCLGLFSISLRKRPQSIEEGINSRDINIDFC